MRRALLGVLIVLTLMASPHAQWFGKGQQVMITPGSPTSPGTCDPMTVSASGTREPTPDSTITDDVCDVWTLGSGTTPVITVLRNGSPSGGFGAQVLWYLGVLYVQGTNLQWYKWEGVGFVFYGPADPETGTPPSSPTYYVSTTGSDIRTCSQAMTVSTPKRTFNSALPCLTPGDTLLARGGTYDESILNSQGSTVIVGGTAWNNKVRIAAFPGETVWLRPTTGGISAVIWFVTDTSQYIELDGINLDATGLTDIAGLVTGGNDPATQMAHHIRIQNAEIIRAVTSSGCIAGGCPETDGVLFGSHELESTIGTNEAINLKIHGGNNAFGYGIYLSGPNNLVDLCEIYDTSSAGVQIYNGGGDSADNNIIRNTKIHDISTTAQDRGWGIIVAGDSNLIYNNVIYNLTFTFSSTSAALYVFTGAGNFLANNTIVSNAMPGVLINGGVASTIVKNNIAYLNSGGNYSDGGTSTIHDHNLEGTNPLFASASTFNFRLASTSSPAYNAGTSLSGTFTTDADGIARPQASVWDIGAYEFH